MLEAVDKILSRGLNLDFTTVCAEMGFDTKTLSFYQRDIENYIRTIPNPYDCNYYTKAYFSSARNKSTHYNSYGCTWIWQKYIC